MNCIGRMKNVFGTLIIAVLLLSCTSRKSTNDVNVSDVDSFVVMDSMRPDMPPPPPDSGRVDGHRPPPPPHGKGHHKQDNMRGFDPASEDDMDDNGMSRYMENNDDEGWD